MINLRKYEDLYDNFDGGHDKRHLKMVRKIAVKLAKKYLPEKIDLVYMAATLHDIGLSIDRENHEIEGAELIKKDNYLKKYLGNDFGLIVEAVREHRASTGNPKTILAKIISDADRGSNSSKESFRRAFEYGLKNYPDLDRLGQIKRAAKHQAEKFAKDSYGRRVYFSETEKRLSRVYDPIINAYQKENWGYFEKLLKIE